ncbi:uncharacterized protein J7T54_006867 [Emericellopsis cladophorae]|uniref:Bystin n=1 Tax=Emericellopsis cladophorae TaxID=2686198 RepID=A0A9Q0BHX4_9HYPO|nr:uncharacterized protein J7T54_006867 [Emericellopsis cladophorae]KAI6785225.1 hypothetical protein J7T54_006867 [Emericellopsis cladophorae]
MPKATTPKGRDARRHNPLEDDIVATGVLRTKPGKRKSRADNEDESFVDSKASKNILRIGRELAEEEDASRPRSQAPAGADSFGYDSRFEEEQVYGDDDDDVAWADQDDEEVEEIEVDPEDLATYRKFMPDEEADDLLKHGWDQKPSGEEEHEEPVNLADLILEKIAAHEATEARKAAGVPDEDYELPPKVVEAYTKIGEILARYKSGPLPKPFKILPTVPHWEDIIFVTEPEKWTPNATFQATRIFASSKPAICQRFLEMIVLEKVREDIYENKKLNVHLFNSLKKALYKPSAFFKGFLFPLSAAALKGLCEIAAQEASQGTEGGGATNIFIKTLLEKKYALPYQVIDALVFHFMRFRSIDPASVQAGSDPMAGVAENTRNKLPVIWHQSLLAFAQRYKGDITEDQREALLDLLLSHGHSAIGPEVRRELLVGRGRGVPLEAPTVGLDGDDTMMID